jgi:uncharacterized membrane protein
MKIANPTHKFEFWLSVCVALLWTCAGAALSSRTQLVFSYETLVSTPPQFEILAASNVALLVLLFTATALPVSVYRGRENSRQQVRSAIALSALAALPLLLVVARCFVESVPLPHYWEPVWFAAFSGLAAYQIGSSTVNGWSDRRAVCRIVLVCFVVVAAAWWYGQSDFYYRNFQLGFNDFGHFTQRVANTAEGRGFLMESPVLPTYWDHFNPGLALLVPAWLAWPDVRLVFVIQSICLAGSALAIASIARKMGASEGTASTWGIAWLVHPSIGQMNLAYTYGWHPITLAIPLLLGAFRLLLARRYVACVLVAILACSFEEGVIVVVACFAAAMALREGFQRRFTNEPARESMDWKRWLGVFVVASIAFVLVYKFSGLASFQTGRFAKLGDSASEVLLSPILKPAEFWGLISRSRNLAFISLLLVPLFIPAIFRSPWYLLAIALPLGVLIVWEHLPAQSIAFQYASCLLPVLFVGAIEGSRRLSKEPEQIPPSESPESSTAAFERSPSFASALAAVVTGWVLCLYVGQLPWSQPTIVEVIAKAYGIADPPLRLSDQADGKWLADRVDSLRSESIRVLATGRAVSHLVGSKDIETVSQFLQRYQPLSKLDQALASPILRYDAIVLDFRESFQQTPAESQQVKTEAMLHGFVVDSSNYEIEILRPAKTKK